ncbi:MAG TPA: glycoside hydrolase family 127 protein [Chitinophagaceae bacterium]|nr:glycoside hydrolase family 127 protein [Chitinophagaceae bacterium]
MKKIVPVIPLLIIVSSIVAQNPLQKFEFVNFSEVNITDHFWKPKIDKVATVTMKACIDQTEVKTARIRNFEKAARNKGEKFEGRYYDDSDVYKALEAIAYALQTHPDATLEAKADEWIDKIAAAQLPDGYVGTYYTLRDINQRWTNIEAHEDYNAGHMFEAAVAYYNATGKRKFLDIAIRFANHIDSTFRLGNKKWFSGHEEIELALVKLYNVTKDDRYLKLADWYLQQRGKGGLYTYGNTWFTQAYWQDLKPVKEQTEITGHAVRAMYLYTGAADVAALTGDAGYMNAMKKVWEDVVHRNMYITGGIGSAGDNEGFSKDYDLPNEDAYCETCASVGMVLWNQRMCQLTGDSKYIDVLERSLYNGALDGLSLSGDHFFYDNVLASNGQHKRREWFGTACCPANIARLVTSVGNYIYGKSHDGIWVNLYAGSNTKVKLGNTDVAVKMETNYPWDGKVLLNIDPAKKMKCKLYLRIPGWFANDPVPGGLYSETAESNDHFDPELMINGKINEYKIENGYAVVERDWKKGDIVEFNIPMSIEKIKARSEVSSDKNRIAIQRGPLVYCVEEADNKDGVWNLILPENASFTVKEYKVLDENIIALQAEITSAYPNTEGTAIEMKKRKITAIPYYCWANRGANAMQVWLPAKIKEVKINYQSKYEDGGNY